VARLLVAWLPTFDRPTFNLVAPPFDLRGLNQEPRADFESSRGAELFPSVARLLVASPPTFDRPTFNLAAPTFDLVRPD
jgi:hypothetical protein